MPEIGHVICKFSIKSFKLFKSSFSKKEFNCFEIVCISDWYLIILLIGVEIPLIIVVLLLVKNQTISSATLGSKILKFSTIMGLSAIYTGSL